MTDEKKLLIFDICSRLPYGLILDIDTKNWKAPQGHLTVKIEGCGVLFKDMSLVVNGSYYGDDYKPYLRPLSSMTEEEEEDLRQKTGAKFYSFYLFGKTSCNISFPSTDEWGDEESYNETDWIKVFDWLNAHHFDYRRLIEKGVALPAPEGMYK